MTGAGEFALAGRGRRAPRRTRARLLAAAALCAGTGAGLAQTAPTLNLFGTPGLVEMPSADSQPDAELSATVSTFAGQTRTTLTFQVLPRLSGSFRYAGLEDFSDDFDTFYDRSFDLSFRVLDEGRYVPAVSIGLRDFLGTGVYSGEYVVATKAVAPRLVPGLRATLGLGWGRLGSSGDIGSPFGERPPRDFGEGGTPEFDQYFRGPAAPFGGLEWRPTERLGFKAEYSSDAYTREVRRGILERESDFNFGVEYQAAPWLRLGAYSLYGSEVGVSAQLSFNLKERPGGPGSEAAPVPIEPRPSRAADPEAYGTAWAERPARREQIKEQLRAVLAAEGIELTGLRLEPAAARIWIRNLRYDSEAQALGRTARVATRLLPASVEQITVVPVAEQDFPIAEIALSRSDLEAFEPAPVGDVALERAAAIGPAMRGPAPAERVEDAYPVFSFGLGPYARLSYFDPEEPVRYEIGAEARAEWRPAPGLIFAGTATKRAFGTIDDADYETDSELPPVRTNAPLYAREGDPAIARLTAAYYFRPGADLYGRVTAGYLERMFGGVSGEILWKPVQSRLGLGAELNYVAQREFDGGFGFQDYDVATGHVSAYYDLGRGFEAQVDAGRYLAGDWGATVALDRTFANGWEVGAFLTLTDATDEQFGEGSFDKGLRLSVPISFLTGQPTRRAAAVTLRPLTRDGGARLNVPGRLFDEVEDWHVQGLEPQWGRVFR